jgi:hypothetical protein
VATSSSDGRSELAWHQDPSGRFPLRGAQQGRWTNFVRMSPDSDILRDNAVWADELTRGGQPSGQDVPADGQRFSPAEAAAQRVDDHQAEVVLAEVTNDRLGDALSALGLVLGAIGVIVAIQVGTGSSGDPALAVAVGLGAVVQALVVVALGRLTRVYRASTRLLARLDVKLSNEK